MSGNICDDAGILEEAILEPAKALIFPLPLQGVEMPHEKHSAESPVTLIYPAIDPRLIPPIESLARMQEVEPNLLDLIRKLTDDGGGIPLDPAKVEAALEFLRVNPDAVKHARKLAEASREVFMSFERQGISYGFGNRMSALFAAIVILVEEEQAQQDGLR